jgi:hypothetical protein
VAQVAEHLAAQLLPDQLIVLENAPMGLQSLARRQAENEIFVVPPGANQLDNVSCVSHGHVLFPGTPG